MRAFSASRLRVDSLFVNPVTTHHIFDEMPALLLHTARRLKACGGDQRRRPVRPSG